MIAIRGHGPREHSLFNDMSGGATLCGTHTASQSATWLVIALGVPIELSRGSAYSHMYLILCFICLCCMRLLAMRLLGTPQLSMHIIVC